MAKDYPVAHQCAIAGCSNGGYKFKRWKQQICSVHNCVNGEGNCTCDVGFVLHPFPTAKRNPKAREVWKKLVNREDPNKRGQLWFPSKDSRVCSEHFVEVRPSHKNPYSSLKTWLMTQQQNLQESIPRQHEERGQNMNQLEKNHLLVKVNAGKHLPMHPTLCSPVILLQIHRQVMICNNPGINRMPINHNDLLHLTSKPLATTAFKTL